MRTQIMSDTSGQPWLEFYAPDHSRPETIPIDPLPFTIGRNENADYTIPSGKVSREHAQIAFQSGRYVVSDLGSTNGTFVNGERIECKEIHDGDTVTIADIEMNFLTGEASANSATVTHVMDGTVPATPVTASGASIDESVEFVLGVRRLQQTLTQRCVSCAVEPIVQLSNDQLFGYEIHSAPTNGRWLAGPRQLIGSECRLNERINELSRLFAAEQSARLPAETHLFFKVESSEVGVNWLPESLSRLQETVSDFHRVVVQIPDTAVCDIPYFRDFLQRLRQREILVAYDGFAGGRNQVNELNDIVPDFLKLSHTIIRGIDRSSGGQRQIQAVVQACTKLGCQLVAKGVDDETIAEISRELGCDLAQGDFFGAPQSLDEILTATPAIF